MRLPSVWCRAWSALAIGVVLLLPESRVHAQEPPDATSRKASSSLLPRLFVHRTSDTSDCPDAPALASMVTHHMKRPVLLPLEGVRSSLAPPAGGASNGASLDVQIYLSEEGYTAVVQTEVAAAGEPDSKTSRTKARQLSDKGSSCAGLAAALSITLAIILDTEIPPPEPPPEPPPLPEHPSSAAPAQAERPPPDDPLGIGQGAAVSSAEGVAPREPFTRRGDARRRATSPARAAGQPRAVAKSSSSLGLTAGLGLSYAAGALQHGGLAGAGSLELLIGEHFSLSGGLMAFAPQTFPLPFAVTGAEIGKPEISVSLTVGLLRGCLAFPLVTALTAERRAQETLRPLRVGGCLGLLAGAIHGEATDLPRSSPKTDPWVAGEASALLEQRLFWRVSLVSRAALLIPLVKREFLIEEAGTAFSPEPLGFAWDTELRLSIW